MSGNQYLIYKLLNSTDFVATAGACWGTNYTHEFIIDTNGNVFVKEGQTHYSNPTPPPTKELFSIIDNIKLPDYIIDLLNHLIKGNAPKCNPSNGVGGGSGNTACRHERVAMFFEIVKQVKKSIKEITLNPQNQEDIKYQLEFTITKNELIEKQLLEMEQKIKNIQTAYFDTLKDNEKLQDEHKLLKEQIIKLENTIKNTPPTTYIKVPYDTPPSTTFGYSGWGTKSNAQNRMVYNKNTGIYEPEEDAD
jgi:Txe/YoeB family toxin of Txe-Axe toxin-antitoxin module